MTKKKIETKETANTANLGIGVVSSRFIAITYMIYIIAWEGFTIGGTAYVVFGLNQSGWWFLLGVLLSMAAYSPEEWRKLLA